MKIWDFYFSAGSSTSKTRLSPVSGGERSMSQKHCTEVGKQICRMNYYNQERTT